MDGSERSNSGSTAGSDIAPGNFGKPQELFRRIDSKGPTTYPQDVLPSFLLPGTNTGAGAVNGDSKAGSGAKAGSAFPKIGGGRTSDNSSVPPPLLTPVRQPEIVPTTRPPLTTQDLTARPPDVITPPIQARPSEIQPQPTQVRPAPDVHRPAVADAPPKQPTAKPEDNTHWRFNQDKPKEENNKTRNEWMVRQMDKLLSMGVGTLKFDAIPANAEPRFWKDEQGHYLYFKNNGDPDKKYHLSKTLTKLEMCGKTFDLDKIRSEIDQKTQAQRQAGFQEDTSENGKWTFSSRKLDANSEVVTVFDSQARSRFQQVWKSGKLTGVVEFDAAGKPAVKMFFGMSGLAKIEINDGGTWNSFHKRQDQWQPSDSYRGRTLDSYVKPNYLIKPGG